MKKQFLLHYSGLSVARDGEVFVPQSGTHPAHYTYGCKRKDGYMVVVYKGKPYKVHRLVAETYIPNPENKPCIDHINTNRSDNRVENLRWSTHPENSNNPLTLQHFSEVKKGEETKQKIKEAMKGNTNKPKKPVVGTNKKTGITVEFESATDAWLTLNINSCNITSCCQGNRKSAGGYVWSYLT